MKTHNLFLVLILLIIFSCQSENKKVSKDKNGLEVKQIAPNRLEKTSFYDDGTVEYKFQTFKNLIDGISEEFYPNGRVKVRAFWKNGQQGFLYEKYSDDGTPLTINRKVQILRVNDKMFNICLSDTSKNVIMLICSFKDNFIVGESIVIPVKDGIGTIGFLRAKGDSKIRGVIRIKKDEHLFEESYPFEFSSNE